MATGDAAVPDVSAPADATPNVATSAATVECVAVDSLDAYFGASRIVRDVSFGVHAGQVTAIIGPSGCGK
ncbi:MAG TPA: hypothetical protein VHV78_03185, partial [Gemmatimonadaceae bacterium]|nr:hypothetical protein [Gemmatimonadaceae bacterium]